jgi:hypothetical protein
MSLPPRTPRVLFIAGLGRSGTTLLERLLGQIEGVQTLGEVVHLWVRGIVRNETCGCGLAFWDCPFWEQVGARAFNGWSQVDVADAIALRERVDRLRRVPGVLTRPGADVLRYSAMFRSIYEAAQQETHASLVVDSSKHPSLAYCLRTQRQLDLRVVHVVRDPRAVAYSWAKVVERPEGEDDEKLMTRYTPTRAAMLWNAENVAVSGLSRLNLPVFRLSYEALVGNPRDAIAQLLAFAGLSPELTIPIEDHRAVLRENHTVSGNPLRFRNGVLDIRRDDGWRTGLARKDRRIVDAITGPLRAAYR